MNVTRVLDLDYDAPRKTPQSPTANYPEMMCNGKRGVIIGQPIGTVTLWKASRFEHTGSVDELALLRSLKGMSDKNDPLSVGLVVVRTGKLLTAPANREDVVGGLYSIPVFRAYSGANAHSPAARS